MMLLIDHLGCAINDFDKADNLEEWTTDNEEEAQFLFAFYVISFCFQIMVRTTFRHS